MNFMNFVIHYGKCGNEAARYLTSWGGGGGGGGGAALAPFVLNGAHLV